MTKLKHPLLVERVLPPACEWRDATQRAVDRVLGAIVGVYPEDKAVELVAALVDAMRNEYGD